MEEPSAEMAELERESLRALENPFRRPVLLGCTWYPYGLDMPPWGVAQSDLLIGRMPTSLLLAPSLECDVRAFQAEENALKKLGWTSSELLIKLEEKKILRVTDFGPQVRAIFAQQKLRDGLEAILNSKLSTDELLRSIRAIDNVISDGLCAEDTATPQPKPRQAFYWKDDPRSDSRPFWAKADKIVLTLFLNPDFYLLPPLELWSPEAREALNEIRKRQAAHLDDLVRLKLSQSLYLHKIKQEHETYDKVVDRFLRSHSALPYGNYLERFNLLVNVRNVLRNSNVVEKMRVEWEHVTNGDISEYDFKKRFEKDIEEQSEGLIRAISKTERDIKVNLTFCLLAAAVGIIGNPLLTPVGVGGVLGFGSQLLKSVIDRLHVGDDFPMGRIDLIRRRSEKY